MRIIWLCNTLIGEIASEYGFPLAKPESWIKGIYELLKDKEEIDVLYLFPHSENGVVFKKHNFEFRSYKQLSDSEIEIEQEDFFINCIEEYNPDIIHIFGTELPHSYVMVEACKRTQMINRVIASIQGLVYVYADYYYAYLPQRELLFPTIRDIYRSDTYKEQRNAFRRRGELEKEVLKSICHVTGRTDWDKKYTAEINSNLKYHFCNEVLRESFYKSEKWNVDECKKHSIFVSQSNYPIKGFHLMLEAFAIVLKKYPDAILYTTGEAPYADSLMKLKRQKSYSRYLSSIIRKNNLKEQVCFLGYLDEKSICERFLTSNIFVSPSSIENSPNSVGEAMYLGVPTISSDVGGVRNQLTDGKDGLLYKTNDIETLAELIISVFEDESFAKRLSINAIKHAQQTYDRDVNINRMFEIYNEIIED